MDNLPVHNTFRELVFIDGLGKWQEYGILRERKILLKNYLKAIEKRVKWADLNKDIIKKYILKSIAESK